MFEVGRDHIIVDSPGGPAGVSEQVWEVQEMEGTLLKLCNPFAKAPEILNIASSRFVKAVLLDKRQARPA
ncbi:hypothetical protein GGD66_006872 [Bradyrhizobium sp. CIR48]|uniref:hypothetical protein n=1 Tax=Bradyrhizobium sp. CIR48 TaxID=2663840 RepID=UPI0016059151|nr:hypothetical protein [Bradyrhizobium sp. CIR48]MBB4428285.1 hypothetical protein [Bradyrhizobium sp. CIR48]